MSAPPTWASISSPVASPSPPTQSTSTLAPPDPTSPPTKRRKKDPSLPTGPAKRGRKAKVVTGTHLSFAGLPAGMRPDGGMEGSELTERATSTGGVSGGRGSSEVEEDVETHPHPPPPPRPAQYAPQAIPSVLIDPNDPRNSYLTTSLPPPPSNSRRSPLPSHSPLMNQQYLSPPRASASASPSTHRTPSYPPGGFSQPQYPPQGFSGFATPQQGKVLAEKGTDGGTGFTGKKGHGAGGVKRDVMGVHVLKKEDGDMCTREDIQHDLLHHIFSSPIQAFTPPPLSTSPLPLPSLPARLTFADLYAYTLAASPKVTKGLKEALLDLAPGALPGKSKAGMGKGRRKKKMDGDAEEEKEDEGEEVENYEGLRLGYMKMCLLVNVGRINTTFAFYPEMRTILRAYHSIPSLQKSIATRKSMQDAPRMKNGLKACKLEDEMEKQPTYFHDLGRLLDGGKTPPTTVCNMLFAITSTPEPVNERHFAPYQGIVEVLSIFTKLNIPSLQRAQVFLWLMFRYLESPTTPNPFAGPDGEMPQMTILSPDEYAQLGENVDTPEEVTWGEEMKVGRVEFLKSLANGTAVTGKVFVTPVEGKESAKKDEAGRSVDGSQGDQKPGTPSKTDGPLPMSLARVKDAQAIINRKLRGKTDDNGNALVLPPTGPFKRKRRPRSPGDSNARSSPGTGLGDGDSNPDHGSRPPLQSRNSGYSGYGHGVAYRSPYAGVDTSGLDEEKLDELKRRVEEELGLSPSRSPPMSWEAFRPTLPAFVLPPELASTFGEENGSLQGGSVSPAVNRANLLDDHAMDVDSPAGTPYKMPNLDMMGRKQSIGSSADPDASPSATPARLGHEDATMGPPSSRRGQSIMSLLN